MEVLVLKRCNCSELVLKNILTLFARYGCNAC